jgi:hypothetical protein
LPAVVVRGADFDGQLLAEFPAECVSDTFPRLHLAARKLPRAFARLACGAAAEQEPPIWPEQDADGHRDWGMGLRLHDGMRLGSPGQCWPPIVSRIPPLTSGSATFPAADSIRGLKQFVPKYR